MNREAKRANGRFRIPAGARALLAYQPQGTLSGATALRVWLRAATGTRLTVRPAKDLDAVLGTVELTVDTRTAEPGVESVRVALPTDWHRQLAGGEIVIEITRTAPDATETERKGKPGFFEGAAFVMGDAASRHGQPESSK